MWLLWLEVLWIFQGFCLWSCGEVSLGASLWSRKVFCLPKPTSKTQWVDVGGRCGSSHAVDRPYSFAFHPVVEMWSCWCFLRCCVCSLCSPTCGLLWVCSHHVCVCSYSVGGSWSAFKFARLGTEGGDFGSANLAVAFACVCGSWCWPGV